MAPRTGDCVHGRGGLRFGQFFAALFKSGASSWRFSPGQLKVETGGTVTARNTGGEFHTFTPVAAFGGGYIAALNAPLGLTPVPECGTWMRTTVNVG